MSESNKKRIKTAFRITADTIFVFLLVISLVAAVLAVSLSHSGNFFRLGVIKSGSMKASGMEIGDVVSISSQQDYQLGDVIVFYRAPELYGQNADELDLSDKQVWVHQVIKIKLDQNGNKTYLTQGTSNAFHDGYYVPQEFVLGKATLLSPFLNNVLKFSLSKLGIYLLVVLPCAIMLVYLVWDLVMMLTEKPDEKEDDQQPCENPNLQTTDDFVATKTPLQQVDEVYKQEQIQKEKLVISAKYKFSFWARLALAKQQTKQRYLLLKNHLLGYKKAKSRVSQRFDTIRIGRKPFAKINVRGSIGGTTVVVMFACDSNEAKQNGFNVVPRQKDSQFACQTKIKSDRALKKALLLADFVANKNGFVWQKVADDAHLPNENFDQLLQLGYIKKVGEKMQQPSIKAEQPTQKYAGFSMQQLMQSKRLKARKIKRETK